MDYPTKGGIVEVIDTITPRVSLADYNAVVGRLNACTEARDQMARERAGLREQIDALERDLSHAADESAALRDTISHLIARKAHYKGIVERVGIVARAAILLDVPTIGREVIADALAGDEPGR